MTSASPKLHVPPKAKAKVRVHTNLPPKITNAILAKFAAEDETGCMVIVTKGPSFNPYSFRCRGSRIVIFEFDQARRAHVLRCPLSVWDKIADSVFHSPLRGKVLMSPFYEPWDQEKVEKLGKVIPRRFGNPVPDPRARVGLPVHMDLANVMPPADQIAEELGELVPLG